MHFIRASPILYKLSLPYNKNISINAKLVS